MARSHKDYIRRSCFLKRDDKYLGWLGEGIWTAKGRRWYKRLINKANRRLARIKLR